MEVKKFLVFFSFEMVPMFIIIIFFIILAQFEGLFLFILEKRPVGQPGLWLAADMETFPNGSGPRAAPFTK